MLGNATGTRCLRHRPTETKGVGSIASCGGGFSRGGREGALPFWNRGCVAGVWELSLRAPVAVCSSGSRGCAVVVPVADLAAQVCHPVPGVWRVGRLCRGPLHRHLLHPQVVHLLPAVLRDHPHLRARCCGECQGGLCQISAHLGSPVDATRVLTSQSLLTYTPTDYPSDRQHCAKPNAVCRNLCRHRQVSVFLVHLFRGLVRVGIYRYFFLQT